MKEFGERFLNDLQNGTEDLRAIQRQEKACIKVERNTDDLIGQAVFCHIRVVRAERLREEARAAMTDAGFVADMRETMEAFNRL